jgi:hypothetical protein
MLKIFLQNLESAKDRPKHLSFYKNIASIRFAVPLAIPTIITLAIYDYHFMISRHFFNYNYLGSWRLS